LSTMHTIGTAQKKDAINKRSSDGAPHYSVSWRCYVPHILTTVVIIEGFVLVYIYKHSNIEGLFLNIIIGFVCIAFVLILLRLLIEIMVEIKIKEIDKEVIEYIANKNIAEGKAVPGSTAAREMRQRIRAK